MEGVQLPEDLVVGHGHLRAGPLGLREGDLVLERVQHEVHEVLVPGQVEVDLDLGEELGGGHGQLLPDHLYTKYRELVLIWILEVLQPLREEDLIRILLHRLVVIC